MLEVNKVKNLVNRTPWLSVESWIEQAKGLPRMVEY
jgi:hypothetical protein